MVDQIPPATPTPTSKKSPHWPSAEAEKVRLYEHAQATAKRTQAYGVPSPSIHSRSSSEANSPPPRDKSFSPSVTPGPAISPGAALYQQAVSSITNDNSSPGSPNSRVAPPSPPLSITRMPHYPSAEEEKAALKRYHDAKLAVDRNQNTQFVSREALDAGPSAGPVSYDSLYPEPDEPGYADGSDMPPPFESSGGSSQPHYLNEKERLRRQYEARDAAALAAQAQAQAQAPEPPTHTAQVPSYSGPSPEESGLSEKEILRRRLDEQERAALLHQQQQQQLQQQLQQQQAQEQEPEHPARLQTPPRVSGSRAPPVPPTMNGVKHLTAAEEKARLRAKYEAEDRASANGHAPEAPLSRHPYASATPMRESLPPPPLLPRPPVEYIQETQEADLRGRYFDSLGVGLANALDSFAPLPAQVASPASNPRLEMRPFSPFDAGLGYDARLAVESPAPLHGHIRPTPSTHPAARY